MKYSQERKEAVLRKMMPPHNRSIRQLAKEEGISEPTLYNWRNEARRKGILLPDGEVVLQLGPPLSVFKFTPHTVRWPRPSPRGERAWAVLCRFSLLLVVFFVRCRI